MKKLLILIALLMAPGAFAVAQEANPAQLMTEISRLEEQLRLLRGENEGLHHQITQLQEQQRLMKEDYEFRLSGAPGSGGAMPAVPPPPPPVAGATPMPVPGDYAAVPPPPPPAPAPMESVTFPPAAPGGFSSTAPQGLGGNNTPRDLYNQAFRQLNQTDYAGAERSFAQFIRDFPKDPLIGNAWYWLGETFYVRRDYMKAADSFRQGYEALSDGPKAGDNLLKMAMSLAAMQKDKEACVVLKQVEGKYASNSTALKNKTQQEVTRLGCK